MKRILLILSPVLLAACQNVVSSGINQVGPNTYAISVRANGAAGGVIGAEGAALEEASAFCRRSGQEILAVTRDPIPPATYRTTFRCLPPGDADLRRPETQPDRIIEQRRR